MPIRICAFFICALANVIGAAHPHDQPPLCNKLLTTLARSSSSDRQAQKGNVLEIRSCEPGVLQLAAWGAGQARPLIVETNRTSIVSLATVSDTVYVIQTAGASSNVVQVIVFENNVPRLALNEAVKAYADIRITWKEVVVTIPSTASESQVFKFATQIE